jgi:hypothetical protein
MAEDFLAENYDFGGGAQAPWRPAFANATSRVQNGPRQTTVGPGTRAYRH